MAFYPSLPDPINPMSALVETAGATQQFFGNMQQQQAGQLALEQYKGRQEAMKNYAQTKDPTELMKYDPELVMKMDDAQAKKTTAGISLLESMVPHLMSQPGNEQMWRAAGQDLLKAGAPPSMVQGIMTGSPSERQANLSNIIGFTNKVKVDLEQRKAGIQRQLARDISKEVTIPELQIKETAAQNLAKMKHGFDVSLTDMDIKAKKSLLDITKDEDREKFIHTDLTRRLTEIDRQYAKQSGEMEKDPMFMRVGKTPEEQDQIDKYKSEARNQLHRGLVEARNRAISDLRPLAEKYNIPFAAKEETLPPAPKTDSGAPAGLSGTALDSYNRAAARIAAMPPGQARDEAMQELKRRAASYVGQ